MTLICQYTIDELAYLYLTLCTNHPLRTRRSSLNQIRERDEQEDMGKYVQRKVSELEIPIAAYTSERRTITLDGEAVV